MTSTVASLVYVVRQSNAQIAEFSGLLEKATGKQVEPILRALGKEADVCSAALARLARHHVDSLPEEEGGQSKNEPDHGASLLEVVDRLMQARVSGFCERCDGVLRVEVDDD